MIRGAPLVILSALAVGACGSPGAGPGGAPPASGPDDSARLVTVGGNVASYASDGPLYNRVADMAEASDLVFVGRIVGSRRHVADDGSSGSPGDIEQDGVVFEIEDLLMGPRSVADPTSPVSSTLDSSGVTVGGRVMVAHPAALRTGPTATDLQPVEIAPVAVLRPGLAAVQQGRRSPAYLVFAVIRPLPGGAVWSFNGPGAVAELSPTGVVLATGWPPLHGNPITGTELTVDGVKAELAGRTGQHP